MLKAMIFLIQAIFAHELLYKNAGVVLLEEQGKYSGGKFREISNFSFLRTPPSF